MFTIWTLTIWTLNIEPLHIEHWTIEHWTLHLKVADYSNVNIEHCTVGFNTGGGVFKCLPFEYWTLFDVAPFFPSNFKCIWVDETNLHPVLFFHLQIFFLAFARRAQDFHLCSHLHSWHQSNASTALTDVSATDRLNQFEFAFKLRLQQREVVVLRHQSRDRLNQF